MDTISPSDFRRLEVGSPRPTLGALSLLVLLLAVGRERCGSNFKSQGERWLNHYARVRRPDGLKEHENGPGRGLLLVSGACENSWAQIEGGLSPSWGPRKKDGMLAAARGGRGRSYTPEQKDGQFKGAVEWSIRAIKVWVRSITSERPGVREKITCYSTSGFVKQRLWEWNQTCWVQHFGRKSQGKSNYELGWRLFATTLAEELTSHLQTNGCTPGMN